MGLQGDVLERQIRSRHLVVITPRVAACGGIAAPLAVIGGHVDRAIAIPFGLAGGRIVSCRPGIVFDRR